MIFFCKISLFFGPHHPDRLFPTSPAPRLFGLLRRPTLKNSLFYNEKTHMTLIFDLGYWLIFLNILCFYKS